MIAVVLLVFASDPIDLSRFPNHETATELYQFAQAHVQWVQAQKALDASHAAQWLAWEGQAAYCRDCWENLMYATSEVYEGEYESEYENWAWALRDLLGEDRFLRGEMPPPAPIWRFTRR